MSREGRGATFAPMIVPRWEWRTFGETFGDAEVRLAALPPTRVDETEELYILSSRVEGSIKVRAGNSTSSGSSGGARTGWSNGNPSRMPRFRSPRRTSRRSSQPCT